MTRAQTILASLMARPEAPVRMPNGVVVRPPAREKPNLNALVGGMWAGYGVILLLPLVVPGHPKHTGSRLVKIYGGVMNLFPLVT